MVTVTSTWANGQITGDNATLTNMSSSSIDATRTISLPFGNISSQDLPSGNGTDFATGIGEESPFSSEQLKVAIDVVLIITLVEIMLAMGCAITWSQLWAHCRRPVGLCTGMLSQFALLPLLAFGITRTFGLSAAHSTGILVISSSPGGVLSNTFAYFCDGDLALSVAMTTASTLLALGFIPFNVWLYGRSLETASLVIPYGKIATSLAYVTAPVALGVLIKLRLPRVARFITKVGSWSGFGMIALCIVLEFFLYPDMFQGAPWQLYIGVVLLPATGLAVGYGLARVCQQTPAACRTVAIECGVQNVPVALTVVSLSFPAKDQSDILLFPALYGFSMMTSCFIVCGIYQIHKRYSSISKPPPAGNGLQQQNILTDCVANTES